MCKPINAFPGYKFEYWDTDKQYHNVYRGTDLGKGGYIVSFPGVYWNVALLDLRSMHPTSAIAMNCFGEYTQNFKDLLDARVAIKQKDYAKAKTMLGGRLAPYLDDKSTAKELSQALKIAINSVYGLTAASFENPFRDIRNKNNIVALRGSLFMRTLQDEIESRGYKIVAIKTDSIKIANATKEIVDFCFEFAEKYSYVFEFEACYDRICQLNDADYIARYKDSKWCEKTFGFVPGDNAEHEGQWTVTGAKFAVPYVLKTLFTKEPLEFADFCETKAVKSAIYLDKNENLPEGEHDYQFVGKVGLFCPVKPGCGGGILVREAADSEGNIKYDSVTGTLKSDKVPYRWLEAEHVKLLGKEDDIDKSYFKSMVDSVIYGSGTGKARKPGISDYCDFEKFVSDEPYIVEEEPKTVISEDFPPDDDLPWYISEEEDYFSKR